MEDWRVYSKKADFNQIGARFSIDPVVARIIRNRDVVGDDNINKYLNGTMKDLYSPHLMKDMDLGVELANKAINAGDKIRIIGDYDIDGICSIYILYKGLTKCGANVDYEVPDRIIDGYGINESLIDKAYKDGIKVIITCDNGIAAIPQIEYAKKLGMTVIVTDHHDVQYVEENGEKKYIIPNADAVINPKQEDCKYPFDKLCGAVVAYKFVFALFEQREIDIINAEEFIQFAAIATIGDIVDLQDENRILVKEGLKRIKNTENQGLLALIRLNELSADRISAYHIGFIIGPCLNASGRLDSAKRAISLFLTEDREVAEKYAGELKALNDERKNLTLKATEDAIRMINETSLSNDKVLVVYLPDCHESIAGIVAGRIKEQFYKPAIVLTKGSEGLKGSARSIEGYNIFEKLLEVKELLTKFGGHPMAAGLSLKEENLESLRRELNNRLDLKDETFVKKIWIDAAMPVDYVSFKLVKDLECLAPLGKANEKPVFADKELTIRQVQSIGKNNNFTKLYLENKRGFKIDAVGFFDATELKDAYANKKKISCTYYPEINEFRGNEKLQINITGYKIENQEE